MPTLMKNLKRQKDNRTNTRQDQLKQGGPSNQLTKGLQTLEMQDANINEKPLKDKKGQQE